MKKETNLCMGCMSEKIYSGPCKICGYAEETPYMPSYLAPQTFLNERYIIGKLFSYNGEGAVYIGFDTVTGSKVTIKEYMPDTLCTRKKDEEEITVNNGQLPLYKTYLSEFVDLNRTLMKSRGMTHLQTVLDIFTANNTAYVVYEYINGITLKTYLQNSAGDLSWEQVKELFPPIFTTLSLVHAAGVIHRGISTSTIFVTDKMELKLTGFAISAARTTNTEIACEVFSGCAAPEQYSSNNWQGTWTDVYGISAVLYRVLTGCMPTEAIVRTGADNLLEPMMINRNVPTNVSKVIMNGLKLSTDTRIQTITEFVDRLFEQPKYVGIDRGVHPNTPQRPAVQHQSQQTQDRKLSKKEAKRRRDKRNAIIGITASSLVLIAFVIAFIWSLNNTMSNNNEYTESVYESVEDSMQAAEDTTTPAVTTSQPQDAEEPTESAPNNEITYTLPDLTGRKYDNAATKYTYINIVATYEFNNDYSEGLMYGQDIEPETMVTFGTEVHVNVSKGPKTVALPPFEDKTLDEYIGELNKLNIKYTVETKRSNDVDEGMICDTSINVGASVDVENGEVVTVYRAKNFKDKTTSAETTAPEVPGELVVD